MAIINVRELHYEYPEIVAIKRVSFNIEPGTVTAIIGPSGAGKTTLMNCLTSLMVPQRGDITIDNISVIDQPRQVHKVIGYLPDFYGVYADLTVSQCLHYTAMARKISPWEVEKAVENAAVRMEIFDLLKVKAGHLSHGQTQRVAIAQAIIHNPKVLLLDEPTSGLDLEARHHMSRLFANMASAGMTLLVSSHILAELEEYCTHVMMLRQGELIEHSEIKSARAAAANHRLLELILTEEVKDLEKKLKSMTKLSDVIVDNNIATFEFSGDAKAQQQLLKQFIDSGLPVCGLAPREMKIEDTYLRKMAA